MWVKDLFVVVVPFICAFISYFLYVPWPGLEFTSLEYQDGAPTNWATQPGNDLLYVFNLSYSVSFEYLFSDMLLLNATVQWGKKHGLLKLYSS